MNFELPKLTYTYDALEPFIDAQTMEIHYTKHHQGYATKLNAALEKFPELANKSITELLSNLDQVPEEIRNQVRNSGGGFYNHNIYWKTLLKGNNIHSDELNEKITHSFGSFKVFQDDFTEATSKLFGSGWVWLVVNDKDLLEIVTTANQDNPISNGLKPILGIDLWEHAYYLKYQNNRPNYVTNWWNVINWEEVENLYHTTV